MPSNSEDKWDAVNHAMSMGNSAGLSNILGQQSNHSILGDPVTQPSIFAEEMHRQLQRGFNTMTKTKAEPVDPEEHLDKLIAEYEERISNDQAYLETLLWTKRQFLENPDFAKTVRALRDMGVI